MNPAKCDWEITACQAFEQPLAIDDIPEEFVNATVVGEIVGLSDTQLDRPCVKCRKVVQPDANGTNVTCNNLKSRLTQKVEIRKAVVFESVHHRQ